MDVLAFHAKTTRNRLCGPLLVVLYCIVQRWKLAQQQFNAALEPLHTMQRDSGAPLCNFSVLQCLGSVGKTSMDACQRRWPRPRSLATERAP